MNKQYQLPDNVYAVTGETHGSIIEAGNKEQAKEIFKKHYKDEKIMVIKDINGYNFDNL